MILNPFMDQPSVPAQKDVSGDGRCVRWATRMRPRMEPDIPSPMLVLSEDLDGSYLVVIPVVAANAPFTPVRNQIPVRRPAEWFTDISPSHR